MHVILFNMSPEQLHIIQHSLGCDKYGISINRFPCEKLYYRNHYVSDPTPDLTWLVDEGYMTCSKGNELSGQMNVYRVAGKGISAMKKESPPTPKLTRSQKRYKEYLHEESSWSFGEWLKYGGYKKRNFLAS